MATLIGTAGWSLPRAEQEHFASAGSHLERYAMRFPVVEINSSFHRSHRAATWLRWRDSVPESFRFSVKMPKTVTHTNQLREAEDLVAGFLEEIGALGSKLGCLLVQLPPKLLFDSTVAGEFFTTLRAKTGVPIACEPRHASWFEADAEKLLASCDVARVAADPAPVAAAAEPGGSRRFNYYRLHGSPKMYYSAYSQEFITSLAAQVTPEKSGDRNVWVIFDNTTLGAATRNALDLDQALR